MNAKMEKTDIIILGKYTEELKTLCNALAFLKTTHSIVLLAVVAQLRKCLMKKSNNTLLILSITGRRPDQYLELVARLRSYPDISIAVYCPPGIPVQHEELFAVGANICISRPENRTELNRSVRKVMMMNSQFASGNLKRETYFLLNRSSGQSLPWEPIPFDPMEVALHETYSKIIKKDERPNYQMVHEYPLSGKPPMMTHIFEDKSGNRIIASKGSAEAIMAIAALDSAERETISEAIRNLSVEGYRVLAVGKSSSTYENYPKAQQDFQLEFIGLVAFYDPPKNNSRLVLQDFYKAGIKVKIITGDNAETTASIARQIGFMGHEKNISGNELMLLSDEELKMRVADTNLFTRMFPEAKLRIINALKANKEIVAMTGDGVNDGPALKAAHIGIAMGKKGTEIAKQAASLILIHDDLSKMVKAIAMGRKIYVNLKKAVQFIISIHIPIILTVFIPLALGWMYPNIFSPVHIIFLELIMGPTCSIAFENEPMEKDTMVHQPRPFSSTFFNWRELSTSLLQGLVMTLGTLSVYQFSIHQDFNEEVTRTMVFLALITSTIFLTLTNRSFYYSIFTTLRYRNSLVWIIIGLTILITALLLLIEPLTLFFRLESLDLLQLSIAIGVGCIAVLWYEIVKAYRRNEG